MMQRILIFLIFLLRTEIVISQNEPYLVRCTVKQCLNCEPKSSVIKKQMQCEGTLYSINERMIETSQNYTVDMKDLSQPEQVARITLRKLKILKIDSIKSQFNLSNFSNVRNVLIEKSIIKELDNKLMRSVEHLAVLDSKIFDLKLSNLVYMTSIYIRSVQLGKIDLKHLINLKQLVLKDLKLKEMDTIENLNSALTSLILDTVNILINDKSYFNTLVNLNKLVIKNNRFLNDLIGGEMFRRLYSLTHLDLTNNRIQSLSTQCFTDLSNLQVLILNNNDLKAVNWEFYGSLKKLTSLSLRNNSINTILESPTRNLTELRQLDFSFNQITEINEFTFYDHYLLVELDLKHNAIQRFQKASFDNLKNLTYLNVDRQMNGSIRQNRFYRKTDHCGRISLTDSD